MLSALSTFGSYYPWLIQTLQTVTLWSSRPNLMGHQSPNPPQPAQLLGSDHIQTRHRGPSVQLTANLGWHLWNQDLPEFTHSLKSCGPTDQPRCPRATETAAAERKRETDRPRKTSTGTWWPHFCGWRSRLKNIWSTSLQSARGRVFGWSGVGQQRKRTKRQREIDKNTNKSTTDIVLCSGSGLIVSLAWCCWIIYIGQPII